MTMIITRNRASQRPTSEAIVFPLFSGENVKAHPFYRFLSLANQSYLRTFVKRGFSGERGETDYVVFPSGKQVAFLVGLGQRKDWNRRRAILFFRRLVNLAGSQKVSSLACTISSLAFHNASDTDLIELAATNLLLAEYSFGKYQKPSKKKRSLKSVELMTENEKGTAQALRFGKILGTYSNLCRDWANTPAGDMTPKVLAQHATDLAKSSGCTIRVLNQAAIAKEKMGALLGVAKGSIEEPRFIILEYKGGNKNDAPLVFVGKGVTFDSGGINLKPGQALSEMHMDMSGGAAVLCATAAIAELKLPINVVALVPAVENMPSGSGYRPGDVLVSRSGITIEVGNTDAEGRVILSDALDFAKQYKPQLVVDAATLTGSAMVALGSRLAGLFTASDALATEITDAAESVGDPVWRLPMTEDYEDEIKGSIADVTNSSRVRYGDAIHGALFLKRFIGNLPWAHLDIAPTMTSTEGQFLAKGATGTSVRIFVELARRRSKKVSTKKGK